MSMFVILMRVVVAYAGAYVASENQALLKSSVYREKLLT